MPDFRKYVRENLSALNVSGAREAEIVEEALLGHVRGLSFSQQP
jgi:hypothetical protein